jgi:hypothetical protein
MGGPIRAGHADTHNMFLTARPPPEMVTASRANGRPSIQLARPPDRRPFVALIVRARRSARGTVRRRQVRQRSLTTSFGFIGVPLSIHYAPMTVGLTVGLAVVGLVVAGGVIIPAVWSRDETRRKAALAVLDRIFRWKH